MLVYISRLEISSLESKEGRNAIMRHKSPMTLERMMGSKMSLEFSYELASPA